MQQENEIMKLMSRRALTPRLLATSVLAAAAAQIAVPGHAQPRNSDPVGPQADGSIVVSSGQTITPAGAQTLPGAGVAPTAVALNPPDGQIVVGHLVSRQRNVLVAQGKLGDDKPILPRITEEKCEWRAPKVA